MFWLKEESMHPEKIIAPNAYFNIKIKSVDLWLNLVQSVRSIDSFIVATKWTLGKDQIDLYQNKMNKQKRIEYYWDLQFMLLNDSMIGDFKICSQPPNDFKQLFVSSKRIFYDGLTKQKLMDSIVSVHKAMIKSVFLLERYSGVFPPYSPSSTK